MKYSKPNVLLIVSDDHGYADRSILGIHGNVYTPALDRLAEEGVTCRAAYSTAPICSPARGALMTGRYPMAAGVTWFGNAHLPEERTTLAESLAGLGYATGHFGKVHYGFEQPGDRGCPPNHGFAESLYGLGSLGMGRMHYLQRGEEQAMDAGEAAERHGLLPLFDGDRPVEPQGFLTHVLADRAGRFISDHQNEPFFCSLAFNAVHNFCWQLPEAELEARGLPAYDDWDPSGDESYAQWYDRSIAPNLPHGREYYLAQLELMDAAIGRLLSLLDDLELADNTIVIYTSDHGGSACNYGDNTPLRAGKYTLWEGGIRIPYLVRWPTGAIPAGTATDAVVSHLDVFPTVVAAAGGTPPDGLHGIDQLPVFRGNSPDGHNELHWDCGFMFAVRDGRYKLVSVDGSDEIASRLIRNEHTDPGDGVHLYDLVADPSEATDLGPGRPEAVARLLTKHSEWRKRVTAP